MSGLNVRYPWDTLVTYFFRHRDALRIGATIRVLELGCGSGNNLWFFGRENCTVSGIDVSAAALAKCHELLSAEGIQADLRLEPSSDLSFDDDAFDFIVDRASLCCNTDRDLVLSLSEVHRCLRVGGLFFRNGYSTEHTSYNPDSPHANGLQIEIDRGSLSGMSMLAFVSYEQIMSFDGALWDCLSLEKTTKRDLLAEGAPVHSEWVQLLRKKG